VSDRLEELGVPPKLLAAIRNEVRSNIEQQLNDLWMVVHSIKDASGKAAPGESEAQVDSAALDELKDGLGKVRENLQSVQTHFDEVQAELTKKMRGLNKRTRKLGANNSTEMPGLDKLQSIQEKLENLQRETGQLGAAAALFESRLVDQENRLMRRLDDAEARLARGQSNASRPGASGAASDELSNEYLLSMAGTVEFSLADLAKVPIRHNASDLIVRPNSLPYTYLEDELIPIGQQLLTANDSYRVIMLSLTLNERKQLVKERTFSKLVEYHSARFLLNAYFERGELGAYVRRLTAPPISLEQLDLPRALEVSLLEDRGLILLCGGAMGQLRSVAYALLQPINRQRRARIFTLEDAVSYELPEEQSLVSQLQRGIDIHHAGDLLRLKPDVLMLQRVASGEELQVALTFASEKTLVIACCPGAGVVSCVQHLLELTAPEHRGSILGQLATSLRSILCYREPQPNEYLLNSAKVRPWLERGDMSALETAVETSQPGKVRPAPPPPAKEPEGMTLPPPSTESLSPIRTGLNPPPEMDLEEPEEEKPPAPKPAAKLQPPPTDPPPPEEKSGGDEETLLGWL
jgi:Tfp pilus assembly pilus retraction ATPase PilT